MRLSAKNKSAAVVGVTDHFPQLERIKQLRIKKGYTSYEYFAYGHNISRTQLEDMKRGMSSSKKIVDSFEIFQYAGD